MGDAVAVNRACLEAIRAQGTGVERDGVGLWRGAAVQSNALLDRSDWSDADAWHALHLAAYHLPQLKDLKLAPIEPEGDATAVPAGIANQYTAWWGPKDAIAISRRRAQEARIYAGLEVEPESFISSQRYTRVSSQELARMEAIKGVLLVRRGSSLPMVSNRLRNYIHRQGNGHLQLALRPGLGDEVKFLVMKENRLTVTPEASSLLAEFENQMLVDAKPKNPEIGADS